jgi:hypothetical protein
MNFGQMGGFKSPDKIRPESDELKEWQKEKKQMEDMLGDSLDGVSEEITLMTRQELLKIPVDRMYPKKVVSWGSVRNIINRLTNGLYDTSGKNNNTALDLSMAYISNDFVGGRDGRMVRAKRSSGTIGFNHDGEDGTLSIADSSTNFLNGWSWEMYKEEDLEFVDFSSASSRSRITAEKVGDTWEIQYIPPDDSKGGKVGIDRNGKSVDRFYQGFYFDLYALGDKVKNIDEFYAERQPESV